VYGTN